MPTSQVIVHKKGHFLRETQADFTREASCFGEVDEVFQGESEGDGFGEVDGYALFWLFHIGVLAEGYGAAADVTLAGEFDAIFGGFDYDCRLVSWYDWELKGVWIKRTRLRQGIQVPTNPLELSRRHLNCSSIIRLRDSHMLLVDIRKFDLVLAHTVRFLAFKHQVHDVRGVLCF